jgi:hypothetical protein
VSKHELNLLTENRPHQGLVLDATPLEFEPLTVLPTPDLAKPPVWLALDEVTDPQNLGAILRCAWFLGAAGAPSCSHTRGVGKPPTPKPPIRLGTQSRAKAAARLDLEVSAGWARPSSHSLWGGHALHFSRAGNRNLTVRRRRRRRQGWW